MYNNVWIIYLLRYLFTGYRSKVYLGVKWKIVGYGRLSYAGKNVVRIENILLIIYLITKLFHVI